MKMGDFLDKKQTQLNENVKNEIVWIIHQF